MPAVAAADAIHTVQYDQIRRNCDRAFQPNFEKSHIRLCWSETSLRCPSVYNLLLVLSYVKMGSQTDNISLSECVLSYNSVK